MNELEKYKVALFMTVRLRIMPNLLGLGKSDAEINTMVLETMDTMFEMFDWERASTAYYQALEAAEEIEKEFEPKALSLEALRGKIGKPVWLDTGEVSIGEQLFGRYEILESIINKPVEAFWFTRRVKGFSAMNYGKTWLAYDRELRKDGE